MAHAIRERDQHCLWPGCTHKHHLHIQHLEHWDDGGATSVQNGASMCASHQTLVHERGNTVQHVEDDDQRLHEQFVNQQHAADNSQFDVEKDLRNNRESFDTVRKLLPDSYRFQMTDAQGWEYRYRSEADADADSNNSGRQSTFRPDDYTCVESGEPVPDYRHGRTRGRLAFLSSSKVSACYACSDQWVQVSSCHQ